MGREQQHSFSTCRSCHRTWVHICTCENIRIHECMYIYMVLYAYYMYLVPIHISAYVCVCIYSHKHFLTRYARITEDDTRRRLRAVRWLQHCRLVHLTASKCSVSYHTALIAGCVFPSLLTTTAARVCKWLDGLRAQLAAKVHAPRSW